MDILATASNNCAKVFFGIIYTVRLHFSFLLLSPWQMMTLLILPKMAVVVGAVLALLPSNKFLHSKWLSLLLIQ